MKAALLDDNVQQALCAGEHAEFGVDTTAREALALGGSVILGEDAATT